MPKISVIIPTWNSARMINQCLECLAQQTFQSFEIIIIDNSSSDGSIEHLKKKWSTLMIKIEKLAANKGYATANNVGARLAHGRWLALLNADAFPESTWLEKLLQAAQENPDYIAFSSRQIQANMPERLDGAGDSSHITGIAWRRYYNKPAQEYGYKKEEIFSACPAAALYSREVFLNAGGFDEDYFSYF